MVDERGIVLAPANATPCCIGELTQEEATIALVTSAGDSIGPTPMVDALGVIAASVRSSKVMLSIEWS
jgi:hypothetical protein